MSIVDEATTPQPTWTKGNGGLGRPGWPVDPHRVRRALWEGRRWLIGAGVAGVVIGFLWAKVLMTNEYETVVILRHEGDLEVGALRPSGYSLGPAAGALARQSVLRKIRDELGFESTLTELAGWLQYEVNSRGGTLSFSVSGETAEDAARYARVVTDVFMAYHKERQSRRIEDELARTSKRIEAAEDAAEEARRLYNAFREEQGIADLSSEQQSVVKWAAELRAKSELATLEIGAREAEVGSLETQLTTTPKTSWVSEEGSPELDTYHRLRGELASARATLSADHPRVQALQQQVDDLRSQVRSRGGARSRREGLVTVNTTYQAVQGRLRQAKSSLEALRERQKGLSAMADKAQSRAEGFSDIEGEAAGLLLAVKVNESLVAELRGTEALLEDALHDPPSGFIVLDPGAVPEYPKPNRMKVVVFFAVSILCIALALFLVLQREFRGLRLKTPAEIAFWGNGPVLAATSWPNDPQGLDELVAGLDDFVPEATGSLLVVGASGAESPLAGTLTQRMNGEWFPTSDDAASRSTPDIAPYERAPLPTPPPSGPYPVGSTGTSSTALVRRPSAEPMQLARRTENLRFEAWEGPYAGQALRRAARLADRVVALVRSDTMSPLRLNGIQNRIGRREGIGYIVVGLPDELRTLPDRAGDVASFWRS